MDWWKDVEAVIEAKSLLKHPFYQAWTRGELTRDDLAEYARQYYHQESRFPRYVSAVHSNCPELPVRQALLENLNDEERGAANHPELWLRFAESVGAERSSVAAAQPNAGTRTCVETFDRLCRNADWRMGLAALYAYEAQQPAVAKTKIEGLRERYGLDSEAALGFFQVHQSADAWHSEAERKALEGSSSTEERRAIVGAVGEACDALNALLDGVCEARGIACAAH